MPPIPRPPGYPAETVEGEIVWIVNKIPGGLFQDDKGKQYTRHDNMGLLLTRVKEKKPKDG